MQGVGGNSWSTGRRGGAARSTRSFRSLRSSSSPSSQRHTVVERSPFLVQVIDACLLCLLFVAPLLMGGRHPVGYFAWMAIASVLGLATVLHYRAAKPSAGDYVWLAAAGLVILQLIPMPPALLTWLNPGLGELLPGLVDPSSLPFGEAIYGDRPISINPYRTRLALGMLLAYGMIFHAITRRVQTTGDVRRVLGWMATATVAIAILALAQRFAGNGKFLWVYQHISRSASDVVKGPFQNQNHLAQLMALGLGPLLFFATSRSGQWKTVLATCGATLCLLTGLLTFSRGGAIAIATAVLVASGGLAYSGHVSRQRYLRLVLPALVTLILLGISGGERLLARVETLTGTTELSAVAAGRLELWQAHLKAVVASPWVGYGAATHEDVYPAFIAKDHGVNFTHGESGYIPIQLENGLLGSLLLACVLALAVRWAWRCLPRSTGGKRIPETGNSSGTIVGLSAACVAGLAASALQSVADFVWYIPACLTPALMLLACVFRLASLRQSVSDSTAERAVRTWNVPWLTAPVAVLLVAATWGVGPVRADHLWHQHRIQTPDTVANSTTDLDDKESLQQRLALLKIVVHCNPSDPVHRFDLASAMLTAYDLNFTDAGTPHKKSLAAAAHHTLTALQTAPLSGEGYLILADLHQRSTSDPDKHLSMLKQAVRVRGSDTDINFKAGLAALKGGHVHWGLETWKPVMEFPTRERNQLLTKLNNLLPMDLLLASFSLDHTGLSVLYNQLQRSGHRDTDELHRLGRELVASLSSAAADEEDPITAAAHLHKASFVLQQIEGVSEQSLELARRAVAASPADFSYRIRLTDLLIHSRQQEEAKEHLRWCQLRKPSDPKTIRQKQLFLRTFR